MRSRAFKIFISIILIISLVLGLAAPASAAVVADDIIVSIVLSILASWGLDIFITEFENNESFTAQVIQYIDDFVGNIRPSLLDASVPSPGVIRVSKLAIQQCYTLAQGLISEFDITPKIDVVSSSSYLLDPSGNSVEFPVWSVPDPPVGEWLYPTSLFDQITGYSIPRSQNTTLTGSNGQYISVVYSGSSSSGDTRVNIYYRDQDGLIHTYPSASVIQHQPVKFFVNPSNGNIGYSYYYNTSSGWKLYINTSSISYSSFAFSPSSSSGDSLSFSASDQFHSRVAQVGEGIADMPSHVYLYNPSVAPFETLQTGAAALSEWLVSGADVGTSTLPDQPAIYESLSTIVDTQAGIYSNTRTIAQTLTDVLAQVASIAEAAVSFFADIPFYLAAFAGKFLSIWHYVVDWLASISGFMGSMGSIWSRLPYALVVPMYASIALTIIIGMYRRFFM